MNRPVRDTLKDERGLTLVEVLAAVTILAIISVTIIGYFISAMEKSADESRRIIASNLARLKAAEFRQMIKRSDIDSTGKSNYQLMYSMIPHDSKVVLTGTGFLGGAFASSAYSNLLAPTVINGTSYNYRVTLNPEGGAGPRTVELDAKMTSDSGEYLIPMSVQVAWDGDLVNPKPAKMTTLSTYLIDGR